MAAPPTTYRDDYQSGENMPGLILSRATQERLDRIIDNDNRDRLADGLKNLFDKLTTRLEAIDKASEVLAENVNRVPTLLDREISRLRELFAIELSSIRALIKALEAHFDALRGADDLRYQQRFDASGKALDAASLSAADGIRAALSAAKEAVAAQNQANADSIAKSEASVSKQIDATSAKMEAMEKTLSDKIAAINERLSRGDGSSGAKSASQATMLAVAALVVAVVAVGTTFFHPTQPVMTAPAVVATTH